MCHEPIIWTCIYMYAFVSHYQTFYHMGLNFVMTIVVGLSFRLLESL